MLRKGGVILVDGRLSLREDNAPTVIASLISACPKPGDSNIAAENDNNKQKRKGLFIRVSGENYDEKRRVENLLSIFDGNEPVYIYYNDTKKYSALRRGIYPDKVLVSELKRLVGDKNVVLK